MQEITLADHADYLVALVDAGTALIPRSASHIATAGTVASSPTEITSLVIASIARIGSPQAG
jgi:hypothetical protein